MWNKYSFLPADKHESLLQIDGITLGVILCTPPPLSAGWIEPPTKFSKGGGGGLAGSKLLEGVAGNDFFQGGGGGLQFSHK